jgi:hypothetical protein
MANELLPFGQAVGSNVMDQAAYDALAQRLTGFVSGTAQSAQLNKVWRQSALAAYVVGQFMSDSGFDALDNGDVATFLARFKSSVRGATPAILTASTALTAAQLGVVQINATGGARTITLPAITTNIIGRTVTIRRTDASTNQVTIAASGSDLLYIDNSVSATGVASYELIFGGDFITLVATAALVWVAVAVAPLPASVATGVAVITTVGVSSWTVPAVLRTGRLKAKVSVIAGGAGGSRGASSGSPTVGSGAGGGGEGGSAEKVIDLTGVTSVSVTVGAGGNGSSTASTPGSNGGASSFGAYLSATGGLASSPFTWGGIGGQGSSGDVNRKGGGGGNGYSITTGSVVISQGGFGGGGTVGVLSLPGANTAGSQAGTPGAGGGGSTGAANGGGGFRGEVTVRWG